MKLKHTKGKFRIHSDAQGPCMVMHPTLSGVAIANLSDVFTPLNGMHDPVVKKPVPFPGVGFTYRPERVANTILFVIAPELLDFVRKYLAAGQSEQLDAEAKRLISKAETGIDL